MVVVTSSLLLVCNDLGRSFTDCRERRGEKRREKVSLGLEKRV